MLENIYCQNCQIKNMILNHDTPEIIKKCHHYYY